MSKYYTPTAVSTGDMSRRVKLHTPSDMDLAIGVAKLELASPYNKAVVVRDENEQAVFSDFKK